MRLKNPKQNLAFERIKILLEQARSTAKTHPERARQYIKLLRKMSMRYNLKLPSEIKKGFCHKCDNCFISGNYTIRTSPKQWAVIITCRECGNIMRHPYRKEKKVFKV